VPPRRSQAREQRSDEREVSLSPPAKPHLEEKLWLALFWTPGLRSLWEKELRGSHLERLREVIPRLGEDKRLATGLRAFFLFADEAGNWLPHGITVYLYGSTLEAIEVSQTIADAGVHYFRLAPPPGQWQALTLLAGSIHADGFAEPAGQRGKPRPAAALLHVVRPDGIRFIQVAQGAVTTGRGPVPARFPSVPEAVSWLLA